ncbi:MAG: hypothetical protein EAZ73_16795 [Oscillatoriales cyanobacterium]|nr:MAG: hypothetical protein EAZ83_15000 [Oscillatoriales cyanobacterium]TAF18993.1 MAG: hypothetical protein EAZ73_16795 [Oscillatoriales cyanobacterium]TAF37360.1 MAG: hypothetical protein EAZ69_07625 [Oscillatoriales cyanobacterium]
MISHLVAIELSETACLSALLLNKRYQIGFIERSTFGDDGKVNPAQKPIQVSDTRSGEIKILDSGLSSLIHLWS